MSTTFDDRNRRVIPRWRPFLITRAFGELAPTTFREFKPQADTDGFRQLQADWAQNKSLHFATDLVGAALVNGRPLDGREAADFILALGDKSPLPAQTLASTLLETIKPQEVTSWLAKADLPQPTPEQIVRESRLLIVQDPRNAFMWVDLALGYESLGLMDRAKRAMRAALNIAPFDRFVLRSAVRLFIHQGDPEEAYRLLAKTAAISGDPWLIAAEVAVAPVIEKSPGLFKTGLRMVEKGAIGPLHLSELSAALATVDFISGNDKRGRKLIRTALTKPTENAVAQASWASRQFGGIDLSPFVLGFVPRSFEANALENFHKRQWDGALAAASLWLRDQPFSSRPAIMGSFVASTAMGDYAKGEAFARAGLIANPHDALLLNNLAFALANADKVDEADAVLARIPMATVESRQKIVLVATHGLVAFRRGKIEEGRECYKAVIEAFSKRGEKNLAVTASLYYALEELRSGSPLGSAIAKVAVAEAKTTTNDPSLDAIRARVEVTLDVPPGWLVEDKPVPS